MRKITIMAGPLRMVSLSALVATLLFVGNVGTALAWTPGTFSSTDEQLLADLTTADRAGASLFPLTIDSYLHSEAEWRAKDMSDRDYFAHEIPPNGTTVFDDWTADGYCFKAGGENIGTSSYGDGTATTRINDAFMASKDGHREIILGRWTNVGFGAYKRASDGQKYYVELFSVPCNYVLPSTYTPITPTRVYDSRSPVNLLHSHTKRTFQVTGLAGIPANATAVTGNLTVTGQTAAGYVALSSGGSLSTGHQPTFSTNNFPLGDTRANDVTVPLSLDGQLDAMYWTAYTSDTTHIIFDVTGYYMNNYAAADFNAITPAVVLNTNTGLGLTGPFVSHTKRTFDLSALSAIPSNAVAVAGNLIVNGQTRAGYVTVSSGGSLTTGTQPTTSTDNFPLSDTRSNGIVVVLGPNKSLDAMYWTAYVSDTAQVTFEVTGYFLASGLASDDGVYHPLAAPSRILDSRNGPGGVFHSQILQTLSLGGSASGIAGNLTVTNQTRAGFVSIEPDLTNGIAPTTHTLNFPTADTRAIGTTVGTTGTGGADIMYWTTVTSDTTDVIFDESGYFGPVSNP